MTEAKTCGQAVVELLTAYGVDTVFGIPGVHTLELYRGLVGSSIRHVQARNEQGAGFMADGYARAGGRPGVCFLISGPGVTNALTPMGQAFADSVPMLVISSDTTSASQGKGWGCLHEVTDLTAVTRPVTAFSARVHDPEEIPPLLARAFSLFACDRPRPVHISIPIDVLARPVLRTWAPCRPPSRPRADDAAVDEAAGLLAASTSPLILAGGGALEAGSSLERLAVRIAAPVVTSIRAKGVVADSHPLSLSGRICRPEVHRLIAAADVVLAIGTELSETDSFTERLEIPGRIIRIDLDAAKFNDRYPATLGIVADAGAALEQLLARLRDSQRTDLDARRRVDQLRRQIGGRLSPREKPHARFLEALRRALPPRAMIFGDMCQVVYTGAFLFPVEMPRRWHYPAGYCTLGCALPNAIGARLAQPDVEVAALTGDGGFMFTCQELVSAVELKLPLPIVVWNNAGYQQIRDDMRAIGQQPLGVDGRNPDFAALAAACGARAWRPDSAESLAAAIGETLAGSGPALIEVNEADPWLVP